MRHTLVALACVALCAPFAPGIGAVVAAPGAGLPPAEEDARARLDASPRHGEMVTIDATGGPVRAWVVHPERSERAPVVIVIHEIFGLTDWIRAVADQLAADGFIAVAPDLLSGKGPQGGGTAAFAGRDEVVRAVSDLPRDEVMARLQAVQRWAVALPASSGRSASVGFCWGGGMSFAYAAGGPGLDAAVVYYGAPPPDLAPVHAPVLGLYGGNDARVTATVDATRARMQELGKPYEPHVYDGAGHGFLRAQTGGDGANRRAAEAAWPATVEFLRAHAR